MTTVLNRMQQRRGNASDWTSANPVLAAGEMGVELDTHKWKTGDGTSNWVALPYSSGQVGPIGPIGATGPVGPTGPEGALSVYEQPSTPAGVTQIGSVWIDSDAPMPSGGPDASSAAANTTPVADGAGNYSFRRRVPQFQTWDYALDNQGNDVNSGPWANLLSDIANWSTQPRGAHVVFGEGDYCLNNLAIGALAKNGQFTVEGQGDATRIFPGGSQGQALTLSGRTTSGGTQTGPMQLVKLCGIRIGYGSELTNPNLRYDQPIITVRGGMRFHISDVSGYLSGTGKLLLIDSIYNGSIENVYMATPRYALPIEWTTMSLTGGTDADSVSLRDVVLNSTQAGLVCNAGIGSTSTFVFDNYKVLSGDLPAATVPWAESYLAVNANAGDTTITLNAGDGSLFAVNDTICIDNGLGGDGLGGFEINKIAGIGGDVLTLTQPLTWPHNTSRRQQVIRGGIGLVLPGANLARYFSARNSHFEHLAIGIMGHNGAGLHLMDCKQVCTRFLRITGGLSDVQIDATDVFGETYTAGGTDNIVLDIPSWAPVLTNANTQVQVPSTAADRIKFDGPITNPQSTPIQATVNINGTKLNIDTQGWIAVPIGGLQSFVPGSTVTGTFTNGSTAVTGLSGNVPPIGSTVTITGIAGATSLAITGATTGTLNAGFTGTTGTLVATMTAASSVFAQGNYNAFGVKLDRAGLRFKGYLTVAASAPAQSVVCTLPSILVPRRTAIVPVLQTTGQNFTNTPAQNWLKVSGRDQAGPGNVLMLLASTPACWLGMDSVPPLAMAG